LNIAILSLSEIACVLKGQAQKPQEQERTHLLTGNIDAVDAVDPAGSHPRIELNTDRSLASEAADAMADGSSERVSQL
jgi:hypothetical protein